MENIYLTIVLAPLVGAILAGFFGSTLGRKGAHWVTSTGVGISALLSLYVLKGFMYDGLETFNGNGLHLDGEWRSEHGGGLSG